MANVVSGRISRIVSCCTDEDGNHLLEVEYCSAGKRSAMISREQFLEDGGRRAKRLLADWDKGAFFNISRVSDMRVNKKRCLEFRVTNAETGVQIWVPEHTLPDSVVGEAVAESVGKQERKAGGAMENWVEWEVKSLLCKRTVYYGVFRFRVFLVRYIDYPDASDEWLPESQLDFIPPPDVIEWSPTSGLLSPPQDTDLHTGDSDWHCFSAYILPDLQQSLREGWKANASRTLSGRVRRGATTFCPPEAYERMFLQSPGCVTTTESGTVHHVYTHPWLVPQTFVGGGGTKWWRLEEETDTLLRNDDGVLVAMRRLTMIHGKYTVHYDPRHHRLGVSFNFLVATKKTSYMTYYPNSALLPFKK